MKKSPEKDPAYHSLRNCLPIWPPDRPFPFSRDDCWALLHGEPVKWRGTIADLERLPGVFEIINGYIYLKPE